MLSQHERRTLAAIEQRLSAEAPDLAQLLARFDGAPGPPRIRHRATWCVMVLGVALLVVGIALRSAGALYVSAMLLMYGAVRWTVTVAANAVTRRRAARARIEP